ncbi:MAG: hypothetical protein Dasosvirus4_22 [Dasosvirus sp.]|uniref:Uncharacterized protein n=1 Tax=Dasosvirus sp. TaxID=2487764 RepID=A0A3G4ZU20_9VIRU|nr:MAG: hypothetical protein Dasosvirus4_22 [Dasosvirus sp.]
MVIIDYHNIGNVIDINRYLSSMHGEDVVVRLEFTVAYF